MKTHFFLLFAFFSFCFSALIAQPEAIRELSASLPDHPDKSEFRFSGSWLKSLVDDNDKDSRRFRSIHIMSLPMDLSGISVTDMSRQLTAENFEILTSFRSGKDSGQIMLRETPEGITDLVLLFSDEDDDLTTISVAGLFTMEDLENIDLDVSGWEHVKGR